MEHPSTSEESAEEMITHPLHSQWTFWYDNQLAQGKRPANWGSTLQEVYTVSTVEDFWRVYNNLPKASQLSQGCGFNLFRKGIEPKWEDKRNSKGGKWTVMVSRHDDLDQLWLWLMLACIGERLEPNPESNDDQICGCVVNIRKGQSKISVWTYDAEDEVNSMAIGHQLKKALEVNNQIGYTKHFSKNSKKDKYTC